MRKLALFVALAALTASASGCNCFQHCGTGWRPGALLFGMGQPAYAPAPAYYPQQPCCCPQPQCCCDPCAGGATSGVQYAPTSSTQPCCGE